MNNRLTGLMVALLFGMALCGRAEKITFTQSAQTAQEKAGAQKDDEVIPWNKAHLKVGQTVSVKGKVLGGYKAEDGLYLSFSTFTRRSLAIVITNEALEKFKEPPLETYTDKEVIVSGIVRRQYRRVVIIVSDPSQIMGVRSPHSTPGRQGIRR